MTNQLVHTVKSLIEQSDQLNRKASEFNREAGELRQAARALLSQVELHASSRDIQVAPDHLNKSEFARLCDVSRETVRRWEKQGRININGGIAKFDAVEFIRMALPKRARQMGIYQTKEAV